MENLKEKSMEELKEFLVGIGEKPFRAKQIFQWIYRGICDIEQMTDLSKSLREKLKKRAYIGSLSLASVQNSKADGTRKYLFTLGDGEQIESVFMKYKYGNSICVSSQVGCNMGCTFCASGLDGKKRNLLAGEIADQLLCVQRDTGEKISHIVVMGMGEPLDNFDQLCKFIDLVNHKEGLNIGMRNITVSTCGLVPMMKKFGEAYPQVNLAISLHGADNDYRKSIMPIAKTYDLETLIKACKAHTQRTGRRITFEYALIQGKNDGQKDIERLAGLLQGMLCHVNLIPLNPVDEAGLLGSSRKRGEEIAAYLERRGIPATIRRELGGDIDAACGQLRRRKK
ncbi:MAG: 23S rRNA (adenine(2503)-C(2))-methyltransferase RlmN [Anaerovoracaceae bacterium]